MPDNNQNPGGQQQHGQQQQQHAHVNKPDGKDQGLNRNKQGGDYTTNIWNKIEKGAAAKDKMNNFKEGEVFQKKKRRRRRRKKRGPEGQTLLPPKLVQEPGPEPQSKPAADSQRHGGRLPQSTARLSEALASDAHPARHGGRGLPATLRLSSALASDAEEIVESDESAQLTEKRPSEPEEVVEPKPLEPEAVPPTPPVAPINPFDFGPPNTTDTPNSPGYDDSAYPASNPFGGEKPINPFDLSDPAEDVKPADDPVYEDAKSPEDTGEADEFKAVNASASVENTKGDDQTEVVDKEDEIIEVKAEEILERKIEPVFPDKIEEKNDFWLVLEHAGITKKKLFVFAIILFILVTVGLFFIFGGMKLFSGSEKSVEPVERVIPEQSQPVTSNQRPYDVISSYIFGLEYQPVSGIQAQPINSFGDISGVDAGIIFGTVSDLKQQQFVEYEQVLQKMNNIYNVNVSNLLDLAVDRRVALDKYLKDMDALMKKGLENLANIEADLVQFNTQYEAFSKQANGYETAFFNYAKNYYGQTAYDNLQLFMDTANQASRIKAQYGAANVLKTMFINSLNALKPRYQDISANTEALIKGVKVFDIKNSDINVIIPVK